MKTKEQIKEEIAKLQSELEAIEKEDINKEIRFVKWLVQKGYIWYNPETDNTLFLFHGYDESKGLKLEKVFKIYEQTRQKTK
jgi:hypothetical protein